MPIVSITLSNFESHKHSVIEFDPNMTVFVGTSEHGKSAVIRALYWVAFNRPSGSEFCSHWGGVTKVEVVTDTLKVIREKGDKLNRYTLESLKDGSKLHFNGFGQSVPKEIEQALNLKDINFKTQFDDNFLLPPISSGEVARQINQYVDLDVIDRALANINSEYRGLNNQIEDHKVAAKALNEEIETEYANLESAEKDLIKLEKMKLKIEKLIERRLHINKLLGNLEKLQTTSLEYKDLSIKLSYMQAFDSLLNKINKINENKTKLLSVYEKYMTLKEGFDKYGHFQERIKAVTRIEGIEKNDREYKSRILRINTLYQSVKGCREGIRKSTDLIKKRKKDIEALMPKGSVCLMCGGIIK